MKLKNNDNVNRSEIRYHNRGFPAIPRFISVYGKNNEILYQTIYKFFWSHLQPYFRSRWMSSLRMYHESLTMLRSTLFWNVWMTDGEFLGAFSELNDIRPHRVVNWQLRMRYPRSQYICLNWRFSCSLLFITWIVHVSIASRVIPRYFASLTCGLCFWLATLVYNHISC